MSDVPVQVVVAGFPDEQGGRDALDLLKEAKRERLIGIEDAAVLRKDESGKLHIKETADMGGAKGAAIGGVAGGIIGAIAGAALAGPILVGALIGGLAAKLSDAGFDNDRLKQVGEQMPPGSSAIIAIVEHKWVDEVRKELAEAGADAMTAAVSAELASQLEAGHDVAYSALLTQEGVVAGGVSGDEDSEAGTVAVLGQDAAAGVEYLATEDGVVVHDLAIGPGGATEGVSAAGVETNDDSGDGE